MAPPAFCSPAGALTFLRLRPTRSHSALSTCRPAMCARRPSDDDAQRDKRAVDAEWSAAAAAAPDADLDMEMLAERAELLQTKERQWGEIIETLATLSAITRLPLLSATTNEPTAFTWLFVTACVFIPPIALFASVEWLQSVSVAFGRLF